MRKVWASFMDWTNHFQLARRAKLEVKCWLGKQIRPCLRVHRESQLLGANYKVSWTIDPTLLRADSVVFSGGVGNDISFDTSLIQKFGLAVHAFDPTPECIKWLHGQSLPDRFHFHPVGIANYDGAIELKRADHGERDISRSAFRGVGGQVDVVPVNRIPTLMKKLGHSKIDLLKIDIEGYEYDVINDLIRSQVPVKQLLVEFHHRWPEIGHAKTHRAIEQLGDVGFRVFAVSGLWDEYSFVHCSALY